jgi:hypothetical protein
MIATIWDAIVEAMQGLGYRIDTTEQDALLEKRYTVELPQVTRDSAASTMAKMRVVRDIRIRVQFPKRKDTYFQRDIAIEIERVVNALRLVPLLFEASSLEDRAGGVIADIAFASILDSMS